MKGPTMTAVSWHSIRCYTLELVKTSGGQTLDRLSSIQCLPGARPVSLVRTRFTACSLSDIRHTQSIEVSNIWGATSKHPRPLLSAEPIRGPSVMHGVRYHLQQVGDVGMLRHRQAPAL